MSSLAARSYVLNTPSKIFSATPKRGMCEDKEKGSKRDRAGPPPRSRAKAPAEACLKRFEDESHAVPCGATTCRETHLVAGLHHVEEVCLAIEEGEEGLQQRLDPTALPRQLQKDGVKTLLGGCHDEK